MSLTDTAPTASAADRIRELGVDLPVSRVVRETADAVSISFAVPDAHVEEFSYRPGQFVTVRVPAGPGDGDRYARSYSLSSAPGLDRELTITVKRTPGGRASGWLVDNAREGMTLRVLAPAGLFTPADLDHDLLLWAAGSGITPVFSIARAALARGAGAVTLVACHRDAEQEIFGDRLAELVRRHPDRFTVITRLSSETGRLTSDAVQDLAAGRPWDEAFVCGPAGFMDTVRAGLRELREKAGAAAGTDAAPVHVEEFTSIEGDPFVLEELATGTAAFEATVALDGATHEVEWPAQATLVDVLLGRGIRVPYSCREGDCGSCMSKLRRGRVEMACTDALEPEDIEDGYILACQARPTEGPLDVEF
ncbi:hypothetical protein NS220_08935 [Microbacterium testaceum]|uniref:Uncharacterized protein n=1 Tax=Microbacterium testaceum TaxID=2033 RepID=A0A147EX60_MICTE|nr:ferredoxin--NADP reductase [Microbacterium testaceum]KTR94520.1 hypothetical protein NS220_08935 [Microbacterium testaceum]